MGQWDGIPREKELCGVRTALLFPWEASCELGWVSSCVSGPGADHPQGSSWEPGAVGMRRDGASISSMCCSGAQGPERKSFLFYSELLSCA